MSSDALEVDFAFPKHIFANEIQKKLICSSGALVDEDLSDIIIWEFLKLIRLLSLGNKVYFYIW